MLSYKVVLLALVSSVFAAPIPREVPQEHSHEAIVRAVNTSLKVNNPDNIQDAVFGLLGAAAAKNGAGNIADADCLQQATADQAFTNAKAAKDVEGMTNALLFRALERNSGAVGQASPLCTSIKAVNPEIAALTQHQDPAGQGAQAANKALTLTLAKQINSVGGDPLRALDAGTFAPGQIGDATAKGNTCDDANDAAGCIVSQNLLVKDATEAEITAAVGGAAAGGAAAGGAAAGGAAAGGAAAGGAAAGGAAAGGAAAGGAATAVDNAAADSTASASADCGPATVTVTASSAAAATATAVDNAADNTGSADGECDATGAGAAAGGAAAGGAAGGGAAAGGAAAGGAAAGGAAAGGAAAGGADFGSCSTPEIEFGVGFDGRKETSFQPKDKTSFNHGSAQAIGIITQFICDTLTNTCKANQAAKDLCTKAQAAAAAEAPKQGIDADAFNAVFGINTKFADVQAIDDQGRPVAAAARRSETLDAIRARFNRRQPVRRVACATASSAAAASTSAAASGAAAGGAASGAAAGGAAAGNIQTFTGALGGAKAPAVTKGGKGLVVEGSDDFLNAGAALGRSCDIQHNQCANLANSGGAFTVGDCDKQNNDCHAAISA